MRSTYHHLPSERIRAVQGLDGKSMNSKNVIVCIGKCITIDPGSRIVGETKSFSILVKNRRSFRWFKNQGITKIGNGLHRPHGPMVPMGMGPRRPHTSPWCDVGCYTLRVVVLGQRPTAFLPPSGSRGLRKMAQVPNFTRGLPAINRSSPRNNLGVGCVGVFCHE